jgi:hypothetical protein
MSADKLTVSKHEITEKSPSAGPLTVAEAMGATEGQSHGDAPMTDDSWTIAAIADESRTDSNREKHRLCGRHRR